jgi:hypothetical protein
MEQMMTGFLLGLWLGSVVGLVVGMLATARLGAWAFTAAVNHVEKLTEAEGEAAELVGKERAAQIRREVSRGRKPEAD